tara:strand:+ start:34384 stop:34764 length:381 start_codon:yes stop_codon:yes gene_type:complete
MDVGPKISNGRLKGIGNTITITFNTELDFEEEEFTTNVGGNIIVKSDGNLVFKLSTDANPRIFDFVSTPQMQRALDSLNTTDQTPMGPGAENTAVRPGTPPPPRPITPIASAAPMGGDASLKLTFI